MKKLLSGYTEIASAKFTFYLNDFLLTLVLYDGEIPKEMFFKQYKLDILRGTTTNYHEICFFGLSFYSGLLSTSLETYVSGYVLGRNNCSDVEISSFSALSFFGSAIDKYFNPIIKYDCATSSRNFEKGASVRVLKPYEDVDFNINLVPHLDLTFGIIDPSEPTADNNKLGDLRSYLRLQTDLEWNLDNLIPLYRNVYRLFTLFNFRRNLSFDQIILFRRSSDGKLSSVGDFVIATKHPCTNINRVYTIDHFDIEEHIVDLYILLGQLGSHLNFIPENDKDAQVLDYSKYIQTCAVFESMFKKYYYSNLINLTPIKKLGLKFKYALCDCRSILIEVFPKIKLSEDDVQEITDAFTGQRNDLAHGDFERRITLSITPYSYAVCMIYIMILRAIRIDEPTIVRVIKKMFWSYEHKDILESPLQNE